MAQLRILILPTKKARIEKPKSTLVNSLSEKKTEQGDFETLQFSS